MSSSASSQDDLLELPVGVRRNGCSTRSGSFCTSVNAMPLGHANPRESGWSGRAARTSRPSSTVAMSPHSGSQIRQ